MKAKTEVTSSRFTRAWTRVRRRVTTSSSRANVLDTVHRSAGDATAVLEASDVVVSGTFRTPWVYQAYIEPQVATAWLEPNGNLVVSTSTQGTS